ncbi:hypothetical protein CC86DRAFT_432279 [Ophiobolus disseminans]|uniref:Uncharacterized protein n=1 Tax=Ophiobolus disseminans TaxID=1469910 RepID=A0A6A6ZDL7_9PLEO|nr:hypothetical protein CC86DRAFT_432279 [Ophiobolus disseminans]
MALETPSKTRPLTSLDIVKGMLGDEAHLLGYLPVRLVNHCADPFPGHLPFKIRFGKTLDSFTVCSQISAMPQEIPKIEFYKPLHRAWSRVKGEESVSATGEISHGLVPVKDFAPAALCNLLLRKRVLSGSFSGSSFNNLVAKSRPSSPAALTRLPTTPQTRMSFSSFPNSPLSVDPEQEFTAYMTLQEHLVVSDFGVEDVDKKIEQSRRDRNVELANAARESDERFHTQLSANVATSRPSKTWSWKTSKGSMQGSSVRFRRSTRLKFRWLSVCVCLERRSGEKVLQGERETKLRAQSLVEHDLDVNGRQFSAHRLSYGPI